MSGLRAQVRARLVDAEITAAPGETVALVGPNGAGKTTLLRVLAGLLPVDAGRVEIAGLDVTGLPAHRRGVGYVPQDIALFPHLSALHNVAYGLRAAGVRRRSAEHTAAGWLDRFGVGELATRRPGALSGGQAQRVALARALAPAPRLLLLDEPLAALDVTTRVVVRRELREHLEGYAGVCLLVTHDPVEAVTLADRVIVLEEGRIVQDAAPASVTRAPGSAWVARMLGWNAAPATTAEGGVLVEGGGLLRTAEQVGDVGQQVLATVHPAAVALHRDRPEGSPRNVWPGRVAEVVPLGVRARVRVVAEAAAPLPDVVAEITAAAASDLELAPGADVWVTVKATEIALAPL
jgi:molybdopterin-binding protein